MIRRSLLAALAALLAVPASAQQVVTLSTGTGYHPVTENHRVIWTEGPDLDAQTLYLWDGETTTVVDQQVSVGLTGWPDLDADGRVAYTKLVNGRYEVMLWDRSQIRQVTNQPRSPAVNLGTRTTELKGGFPSIASGDIVFKDAASNVFLYDGSDGSVRQLTTAPEQRALRTVSENRAVMLQTGLKAPFHFDGRTAIWHHQERHPTDDQQSTFTLWRADAPDWDPYDLATFDAATPSGINGVIAGAIADPNVKACGQDVAWAYRPPASAPANVPAEYQGYLALSNAVIIDAHDGNGTRRVAEGDINPLSLAVSGGTVAWIGYERDEDEKHAFIRSDTDGRPRTIKEIPRPPGQAPAGSQHWRSPAGVFAHGGEVLWVEERVACERISLPGIPDGCLYKIPDVWGVFSSESPRTPRRTFPFGELLLTGSFDQGRYAWRSSDNWIKTTVLIPGLADGGGLVQILDLLPNRVPLRDDDDGTVLVDAFAIRADEGGGECAPGGEQATGATIAGLSLSLEAQSGILAEVEDVAAVRLYRDADRDGQRGPGDPLLAQAAAPSARQSVTFDEPIMVTPGDEARVLVELDLRDDACPCNRYTVSVAGADVDAGDVTVQGQTTGTLVLPAPVIETVWGDAQVSLPGGLLEESLGIRVENVPERCGEARFRFVNGRPGDDAVLVDADGAEHTDLTVPFETVDGGVEAEVRMRVGGREGAYGVEARLVFPEGAVCEPPWYTFLERAGTFVFQVLDANDPAFTEHVRDTSPPDYNTWTVSMASDPAALAAGGEERTGATADGASPLLLRAQLLGFPEAPPGEVQFRVTSDGDAGGLGPALDTTFPTASPASTASAPWHETPDGIVAFALYSPPDHFADTSLDRLAMRFRATYELPGSGQESEEIRDAHLYRPPVLLTHGMWSDPGTWREEFTAADPRFEKRLVDYADRAAWDFSTLGGVMQTEVQQALHDRRMRRIATGKVDVVGHSMGGLITRQYISQLQGEAYRRPDNLGLGDIHRLITIGTPHHGSPLAWLAMETREQAPRVAEALFFYGLDIYSGAAEAMCPGSPQLQQLGRTHVLAHTVRAWQFDSQAEAIGWNTFYDYLDGLVDLENPASSRPRNLLMYTLKYAAALTLETGVQGLYGSEKTDYLVTLSSQGGGIAQGQNHIFENTLHVGFPSTVVTDPRDGTVYELHGETSRQSIADHVFGMLHRDPDDREAFAASLPPPVVDHAPISCD